AAGQALLRNNRPLLAWIGGKAAHFTSKDHNFLPGETVEKQLILINNNRATVACDCDWSLALPPPLAGSPKVSLPTGEQARIPLRFDLPATLPAGSYKLRAAVRFSDGETQEDTFPVQVMARPSPPAAPAKIGLFDPRGETGKLLDAMQVRFQRVEAATDLR